MRQGRARIGTVELAAPQRREEAAPLVGLRVAKQAKLDAVVRQSADLSKRVRVVSDDGRCESSSRCIGLWVKPACVSVYRRARQPPWHGHSWRSLIRGAVLHGLIHQHASSYKRIKQQPILTARTGAKLAALAERCGGTEAAAARAEQVASAAMAAAEGAVRDEMEAAAVAKETASALDKALTDLQVCPCSGCCPLLSWSRPLLSQS